MDTSEETSDTCVDDHHDVSSGNHYLFKKLFELLFEIYVVFQDLHLDQWNISMLLLELLQKLVEEVDRTIHPVKVHMLGEDQTGTFE